MTARSVVRALLDQLGDRFEGLRAHERLDVSPHPVTGDDRVQVAVSLALLVPRADMVAIEQMRRGEAPAAEHAVPLSAVTVRREDIELVPRFASTYGSQAEVTGWVARLDGRLSTGERVSTVAEGRAAREALTRLEDRIAAEGWTITEVES